VNEQNEQAVGFYMHLGCAVIDRSERDRMGMPYPLLHLRLPDSIYE
jgi:putative acetyltransferase